MELVTPTPEEEAPPAMVVLDEEYETAFLGHEVSVNRLPRSVYSLPLLVVCEKQRMDCDDEEKVMASIGAMVQEVTREKGEDAPLFVDDAVSRAKRERSRIITPAKGTFLN